MVEPVRIVFEVLHEHVTPPARATDWSAGYDLQACFAGRDTLKAFTPHNDTDLVSIASGHGLFGVGRYAMLQPGFRVLVPLGFKASLPEGIEAQIRPRSGTAFKKGLLIPNSPGTIDADYPEEWGVVLYNSTQVSVMIEDGERIAQMVLARYEVGEFIAGEVVPMTQRVGGFGSTGQ